MQSYEIQNQLNVLHSEYLYCRLMAENYYRQAIQKYQKLLEKAHNTIDRNQALKYFDIPSKLPKNFDSLSENHNSDFSQQSFMNIPYPNQSIGLFSDFTTTNMRQTCEAGTHANILSVFPNERNQNFIESHKQISAAEGQDRETKNCPENTYFQNIRVLFDRENPQYYNNDKNKHFDTQKQDMSEKPINVKKYTHTIRQILEDSQNQNQNLKQVEYEILYELDVEVIDVVGVEGKNEDKSNYVVLYEFDDDAIDEDKIEDKVNCEVKEKDNACVLDEVSVKSNGAMKHDFMHFKNSHLAIFCMFPSFKIQFIGKKIDLFAVTLENLINFESDKFDILEQCKKASEAYKNFREKSDCHQKLEICYIETLKIFVDNIQFKNGTIKIKPLWKIISLFFPETLGFVNSLKKKLIK
ncbi:hypothetical protein EDEG_03930 [Edhazardia aedis USNM 41457]|uniref:Uncharacterized protein n=1 Tax=Edhazardia aedis (strain USNM 41457) TaxID=1003232 RepID=J9D1N5_EDHAE|nr:hypothetical protein EDEG_03930 [Edhazardia aedis USNM 41457]|eukprot:EJW01489.1 hypothetical protein EDEG_03930 [Edhazardia aedis USNM 41457]